MHRFHENGGRVAALRQGAGSWCAQTPRASLRGATQCSYCYTPACAPSRAAACPTGDTRGWRKLDGRAQLPRSVPQLEQTWAELSVLVGPRGPRVLLVPAAAVRYWTPTSASSLQDELGYAQQA